MLAGCSPRGPRERRRRDAVQAHEMNIPKRSDNAPPRTWLNVTWSEGQEQGTAIGFPSAPLMAPSHLPVPGPQ